MEVLTGKSQAPVKEAEPESEEESEETEEEAVDAAEVMASSLSALIRATVTDRDIESLRNKTTYKLLTASDTARNRQLQ